MMAKRRTNDLNIYEQYAVEMTMGKGDIGRLVMFGDPVGGGEFVIDPVIERWLDAFDAFENADKSKLVALMKSGTPLPNILVPHIGDLLDRWTISRPNHRMRIPSYRMTDDDLKMNRANCEVDDLLEAGKSLADALAEAAAPDGIEISVLREYRAKRRSSERRAKARTKAAKRNKCG
jgi:hypothetical protein